MVWGFEQVAPAWLKARIVLDVIRGRRDSAVIENPSGSETRQRTNLSSRGQEERLMAFSPHDDTQETHDPPT